MAVFRVPAGTGSADGALPFRGLRMKTLLSSVRSGRFCLALCVAAAADLVVAADAPRPMPRSSLQPVGEVAATRGSLDAGLRLTRASTVLRQQLALTRGAGLVVDEVLPNSPAWQAGFAQHDVLVMLDDQLLVLPEQFSALLEDCDTEGPMQCTVLRGGRRIQIQLGSAGAAGRTTAVATRAATPIPASLQPQPLAAPRPVAVIGGPSAPAPRAAVLPADETLLRQDPDFQIRLTSGEQTRLVVTDPQGRVVFNDAIDSPQSRNKMPASIRERVAEMERQLEKTTLPPAAPAPEPPAAPASSDLPTIELK